MKLEALYLTLDEIRILSIVDFRRKYLQIEMAIDFGLHHSVNGSDNDHIEGLRKKLRLYDQVIVERREKFCGPIDETKYLKGTTS